LDRASLSDEGIMAAELAGGERLEYEGVPYDVIVINRDHVYFGAWACPICGRHSPDIEAALDAQEANGFAKKSLAFHHTQIHSVEMPVPQIPWAFTAE
jgi:hypothetical protein